MNKKTFLALGTAVLLNSSCRMDPETIQILIEKNAQKASEILERGEEVLVIEGFHKAIGCFYDSINKSEDKSDENVTVYSLTSNKNSCNPHKIGHLTEIRSVEKVTPYPTGANCEYNYENFELSGSTLKKYDTAYSKMHTGKIINESWLMHDQLVSPSARIAFDHSKCVDQKTEDN